ncbi:MAG: PSP1 domain-containing protein [Spirochaetia bacterium]
MENNLEPANQHPCKKKNQCGCHKQAQKNNGSSFYLLRSHFSKETLYGQFDDQPLTANMEVVCQSPYGLDILSVISPAPSCHQPREPLPILRIATETDYKKSQELAKKTQRFIEVFRQKISQYPDLGMKFVDARFVLDETKVVFFFTAEQRVDFRGLVKELSMQIHSRIELWQINNREETRILGGLAVCGREYCCRALGICSGNVSMKMLKDQSLSPNSTKLSGACGRLFCCLAYEHQQYIDEKKNLPKVGSTVLLNDEKWQIKEINIIARSLTLFGQSGSRVNMQADELVYDAENKCWISRDVVKEI